MATATPTATMTAETLDRLRRELVDAEQATAYSHFCGGRGVLVIAGVSEEERRAESLREPERRAAEEAARTRLQEAERVWVAVRREAEIAGMSPRLAEAAKKSDDFARQIAARRIERRRLHGIVNALPAGDPFAVLAAQERLKQMSEDHLDRRLDLELRRAEDERHAIEQAERTLMHEQFGRDKEAVLGEIRKALARVQPAYQRLRAIEGEEQRRCGGVFTTPMPVKEIVRAAWGLTESDL